jgi:hypothetical protein
VRGNETVGLNDQPPRVHLLTFYFSLFTDEAVRSKKGKVRGEELKYKKWVNDGKAA